MPGPISAPRCTTAAVSTKRIVALRRAIALAPHHANARSGLGILLLMRGDLAEGWDEYEWRLRSSERKGPRFPEQPWQGESLAGKHIYVQAEQGFGDTLQFARYLPLLAARAGAVTLRVHQQLVRLLRESLPGITVLGDRGDPAPYHCDAVLLSLPRLFKTRLETIPAACRICARRRRRRSAGPTRIGRGRTASRSAWCGPAIPSTSTTTAARSIWTSWRRCSPWPARRLRACRSGPRARISSGSSAATPGSPTLRPTSEDFADTAAAVDALDLVITVDTSVAHLAGALGKPVWVLLPWVTDWRWMLQREDNPWYPTMRLFRQKRGEALEQRHRAHGG